MGFGGQVAHGGVAADTCLAFNRKCWSFDMEDRPDIRPEIEPHFWDVNDLKWPLKGKTKPDLIIFDPPAIAYRRTIPKSPIPTGEYSFVLEMANGHWRAGPPHFEKQAGNYDKDAISGLSKEEHLEFLKSLFALAHQKAKKNTRMAFINAYCWPLSEL